MEIDLLIGKMIFKKESSFSFLVCGLILLVSFVMLFASSFFIFRKLSAKLGVANYLPESTILLVESDYDMRQFADQITLIDSYIANASISEDMLSISESSSFELGDLLAFAITENDPLELVYVYEKIAEPRLIPGFVGSSAADYLFVSKTFDVSLLDDPVLSESEGYSRIYTQMSKESPISLYSNLSPLLLELFYADDEMVNLFKNLVFEDFLSDLGVLGARFSIKDGFFVVDFLNTYNKSLVRAEEDSELYSVELADFTPVSNNFLFFDGYGFGQKFSRALDGLDKDGYLISRLVDIYMKDFYESTGFNLDGLIRLLREEYAVYYDFDSGYIQLSFLSENAKEAYVLISSAFDNMKLNYPSKDTYERSVQLRDGSYAKWEVAKNLGSSKFTQLNVGSLVIDGLERGGVSELGFAQVDDVFIVSNDASELKDNIGVMLSGSGLSYDVDFTSMKKNLVNSGSDFIYLNNSKSSLFRSFILGKYVFADNMFLKLIAK